MPPTTATGAQSKCAGLPPTGRCFPVVGLLAGFSGRLPTFARCSEEASAKTTARNTATVTSVRHQFERGGAVHPPPWCAVTTR